MVVEQPPIRRGPRGPYAKSEQTRKAILDAALKVFAESGYRSGSLRNVADRVGMSEAGLLHHFPSKSALLAAVLERRDEQTQEQFDFDPSHGAEILRSLVKLADYNASTPGVVELFCTLSAEATSPEHPAHQWFRDRYEFTRSMTLKGFQDLAEKGELRAGVEPEAASRGVIALMDGLQIQWLLDRDSVDMAADLRSYVNTLVEHPL
ncbi:TetR/AcrR family transcriptional regulator [Naasia sp. SYSU D00057]|uniref:TetR/AcrR family transcriptional regulator n=1 Tax=Naasia sp. SYSU D00057 TaxID=2817380 RepID=UPI0027DE2C1D|nr:TetR/AcrR family transcriptional regulator [Naasia sp. SYSU D00057]